MNSTKSIFASVTFWGSVVSGLAVVAPHLFVILGITPDAAGQATIVSYIIGAIGFVTSVYGRLRATTTVTLTGAPPAGAPLTK